MTESRAAAKLVIQCGEKALTLFREMEQCGRISPSTFRCCETLQVPEDMMTLCQRMDAQYGKPTASKLREECGGIAERRWWSWTILHPELPENLVHKSRRMVPSVLCLAFVCHVPVIHLFRKH